MDIRAPDQKYNPYRLFTREQWAELRNDTPMTLEPGEFNKLRSMHDRLDIKEVEEIYLPLSRLLSIRLPEPDIALAQRLAHAKGLPYQTYIKSLLHEALEHERLLAERK